MLGLRKCWFVAGRRRKGKEERERERECYWRKEKEEREKERVVGDGCDNTPATGPTVSANLRTCH